MMERLRLQGPKTASDSDFWPNFSLFLHNAYRPRTATLHFQYAKRYAHCLATNNLSTLKTLPTCKRLNVMKALSTLAKFTGVYDDFKGLLKAHGLKWTVNTDDVIIARLLKYSSNGANQNTLFEWIRSVKQKIPDFAMFIDFMIATGQRFDEALSAYNLIVQLANEGKLGEYYNAEQRVLEHFRFRSIFLRRTKKVFISFVSRELVEAMSSKGSTLTRDMIIKRVQRLHLKQSFADIHEFYATRATKHLTPLEIDFIQGRTSATVFMRNYFNPTWISDLKDRTLKNANKLLELASKN